MAKQKIVSTTSQNRVKVTIKPKSSASGNMEECHVCDGKGYVPKSWYKRSKK